jgi:hypothetical protein
MLPLRTLLVAAAVLALALRPASAQTCLNGELVDDGASYRGTYGTTVSGRTCQAWTAQSPHVHFRTPARFPNAGLADGAFCRNPDGEPSPWCYTTDPLVQWEYCNVCGE